VLAAAVLAVRYVASMGEYEPETPSGGTTGTV
jgi:hypothetical protein